MAESKRRIPTCQHCFHPWHAHQNGECGHYEEDGSICGCEKRCRHIWSGHSVTEICGAGVIRESWEECERCGKTRGEF